MVRYLIQMSIHTGGVWRRIQTGIIMAVLCLASAGAAELVWPTDWDAALKQGAKEKKLVLAYFSGSDWCPHCKRVDRDIFATKEFQDYAKDHFVLVRIDFPRHTTIPKEQLEKNKQIQKTY